ALRFVGPVYRESNPGNTDVGGTAVTGRTGLLACRAGRSPASPQGRKILAHGVSRVEPVVRPSSPGTGRKTLSLNRNAGDGPATLLRPFFVACTLYPRIASK